MATKRNRSVKQTVKQVHNRYLGKKKNAKAYAKSIGRKPPKGGFKKLRERRERRERIIQAASEIRRKCSNLSSVERKKHLGFALERVG